MWGKEFHKQKLGLELLPMSPTAHRSQASFLCELCWAL